MFQQEHSIALGRGRGGGGERFTVQQMCVLESWDDKQMRFNKQRKTSHLLAAIGFPLSQS